MYASWPEWFPWVGWRVLTLPECYAFQLNLNHSWRAFTLEWFRRGLIVAVQPGPRHHG